ncbi:DUF2497 domain-containing protein [Croceibacterium ferulae]|uniref:DUF2497 domain-containing protein n=1 Tax=Croceibacterium ferulae TaxID=1854641 RepID=UPI000F8637DF|nr:DUF2497 domain-containing protein [Croceibacterium ferulae]
MQLGNEASVEDILASIKRVIARDGPVAPAPPVPPLVTPRPVRDPDPVEPADAEEAGEVLALAEDATGTGSGSADAVPLTSSTTDDALRASFTQLTAIAGLAQDGGAPLDEVVERTLRPLLAQWLDAHLPALVERLVREEIARIAGPRG